MTFLFLVALEIDTAQVIIIHIIHTIHIIVFLRVQIDL